VRAGRDERAVSRVARSGSLVNGERAMLVTLAFAAFLVSLSGGSMAPFLTTMSREFGVSFGAVTHLFSFQAIAWGVSAPLAGRFSDRVGRRPVLLAATAALAISRFGLAWTDGYAGAIGWQVLSGLCGGAFTTTALAAVSDQVAEARRGRALGWIVTGQSMSLLVGVPLLTLIADVHGWRGAVTAHGLAALPLLLALVVTLRRRAGHEAPTSGATPRLRGSLDAPLVRLLAAGLLERITFASIAIYLASFLATTYQLRYAELSVGLAGVAVGNFLGNALGGRVADRSRDRIRTFARTLAVTGLLNLPLMLWGPAYAFSVILGFAAMLVNALGRPAYLARLAEVPRSVRGAMMGLNVMLASVAWLGAALVGGLVEQWGFGVVAVFCAATAGIGAAVAFRIGRGRA
jgi:predicted MFS family arabinose efflux permease